MTVATICDKVLQFLPRSETVTVSEQDFLERYRDWNSKSGQPGPIHRMVRREVLIGLTPLYGDRLLNDLLNDIEQPVARIGAKTLAFGGKYLVHAVLIDFSYHIGSYML